MTVFLVSGTAVGAYIIRDYIGRGGEAQVYTATAPDGYIVALKQGLVGKSHPDYPDHEKRMARLNNLIGLALPQVCSVLDVFECEGRLYVALEWIDGEDLFKRIVRTGSIPPAALIPLADDLFAALDGLHRHDIIHRDIKPMNIITQQEADGTLRGVVVDLGIARHCALSRITRADMPLATPNYAPPEVLEGGETSIGVQADIYSAGATLFEALTSQCPFEAATYAELERQIRHPERPSIRRYCPDLPESLDRCLQRFMAVDPEERPANARDAAAYIGLALEEASHMTRDVPPDDSVPASFTLEIVSGVYGGRRIPIPPRGITLGRRTLNPDDTLLSRSHCRVKPTRRGMLVSDLRSVNGLVVRDQRTYKVLLHVGDTVRLGKTVIRRV